MGIIASSSCSLLRDLHQHNKVDKASFSGDELRLEYVVSEFMGNSFVGNPRISRYRPNYYARQAEKRERKSSFCPSGRQPTLYLPFVLAGKNIANLL